MLDHSGVTAEDLRSTATSGPSPDRCFPCLHLGQLNRSPPAAPNPSKNHSLKMFHQTSSCFSYLCLSLSLCNLYLYIYYIYMCVCACVRVSMPIYMFIYIYIFLNNILLHYCILSYIIVFISIYLYIYIDIKAFKPA